MNQLRRVALGDHGGRGFPFLAALAGLDLTLERPVTFLVGENGSGKSTLLEAVALAARIVGVGSHSPERDPTLAGVRPLADSLRLTWNRRTHRGFFMRAEDFFGFVNRVKREIVEAEREAARLRAEHRDMAPADLGRMLGAHLGGARRLRDRYGDDMDARSHGEQFLALFRARLVPEGLYLLDEPEVALSPTSQLAFLSLLMAFSREHGCQFLVATHSPMLMALPGAEILSFDDGGVRAIAYEEVEHANLTRDFLNDPERYLRRL